MSAEWSYDLAFSRNLGLLTPEEQSQIRQARVAIPGMGGVGGVHLITLIRLGFEKFNIADFDIFEIHNFNRQYGAEINSIGVNKTDWMLKKAKDINPNVDIRVFNEPISESNVDAFLRDVNLVIDGIDAFAVRPRRLVFNRALSQGLHVITAGPLGFSVSWLVFSPEGMSCDDFFGFKDNMDDLNLTARFIAGVSPRSSHLKYMDTSYVNFSKGVGPSASPACQLCAGVAGTEALKIILNRPGLRPVPSFQQFDPYLGKFYSGRLWGGAKNPLFILRRRMILAALAKKISSESKK